MEQESQSTDGDNLHFMCGSRGGIGGPDPPGKSQVIWVAIEISIWTPLEKVGPPPDPRKIIV